MTTYMIVRHYRDHHPPREVVEEGLSLAEAQAWCGNPETSSTTATTQHTRDITEKFGPWFDGYTEED